MVPYLAALLGALTLALSFVVSSVDAACDRGLGWATNNQFASDIGSKPRITWYHHWQDGPVPQMPSKNEFVPMFWGPSHTDLWNQRVAEMHKKTPKFIMAFNEPDVKSQSNMDPNYAAQLYMQQIYPWSKKGVQLCTPAIVYNIAWMHTFINAVKKKGGHVDKLCIHWYGSWKDLAGFKKWVQTAHSSFGLNIWIPELGITSASNPSQAQVKNFMMNALTWLDSQPYMERVAWFGAFESDHPPDQFATGMNAMLKPKGSLSDLGEWYGYSSTPGKRSLRSRHHLLARNETASGDDDAVHCDKICELRNSQIDASLAQLPTSA